MPCSVCNRWDPEPQWFCCGHVDRTNTADIGHYSIDCEGYVWQTMCRLCQLLRRLEVLCFYMETVPATQIQMLVEDFR